MHGGRASIDKRVSRWQVLVKVTDYGQALLGAGGSRGVTTHSGKPPDLPPATSNHEYRNSLLHRATVTEKTQGSLPPQPPSPRLSVANL